MVRRSPDDYPFLENLLKYTDGGNGRQIANAVQAAFKIAWTRHQDEPEEQDFIKGINRNSMNSTPEKELELIRATVWLVVSSQPTPKQRKPRELTSAKSDFRVAFDTESTRGLAIVPISVSPKGRMSSVMLDFFVLVSENNEDAVEVRLIDRLVDFFRGQFMFGI